MPRLANERQERFASYMANGYTQIAAYKAAGYTCKNSAAAANASKLHSDPAVKVRIEELRVKAAERAAMSPAPPLPMKKGTETDVDLDWLNREYIDFLTIAKTEKDLKNAAVLLKDLAELNKIRPEKSEGHNNNDQLPHMGSTLAIQIVNQESTNSGRSSDGFLAIELPDPEPVYSDYTTVNEDE